MAYEMIANSGAYDEPAYQKFQKYLSGTLQLAPQDFTPMLQSKLQAARHLCQSSKRARKMSVCGTFTFLDALVHAVMTCLDVLHPSKISHILLQIFHVEAFRFQKFGC